MKKIVALLMMLALYLSLCMPAGAEVYAHQLHPVNDDDCLVCDVASLLLDLPDADVLTDGQQKNAIRLINHIDSIKFDLTDDEYEELFAIVGQSTFDNYDALKKKISYGWLMVGKKVLGITNEDMSQTQVSFNIERIGDASFGTQTLTLSEDGCAQAMTFTAGTQPGELGTASYMLPVGSYRISEVAAPMLIDGNLVDTAYVTFNGQRADSIDVQVVPGEGAHVLVSNYRSSYLILTMQDAKSETGYACTYTVSVTDPNGSTDMIEFSIYDENDNVTESVVQIPGENNALSPDSSGNYTVPSDKNFTVTMKPGWALWIYNLHENNEFSIEQSSSPVGSTLVGINTRWENKSTGESGGNFASVDSSNNQRVTGTIAGSASNFWVTYTNKMHTHSWTYTADDEANTITAVCDDPENECNVTGKTIVVKLTDPESLIYDGNEKKAAIAYSVPDVLTAEIEYTGEQINVTESGFTAAMTLEDVSVSKTYSITPASIADAIVSGAEKTYTGDPLTTDVTVILGENNLTADDYNVTFSNNVNAGSAAITVAGKGNYKDGAAGTFDIQPANISDVLIKLDQTSFVYDGTEKKPAVTEVRNGNHVIQASEYNVSYSNNVNAGTATVTITDAEGGNYIVSGSTAFAITQAETALTAQTDKPAYTYGDVIIVTGTAAAPKQETKSSLLRFNQPDPQQVALYDEEGRQLTNGVNVMNGAYILTYDTKNKAIAPAAIRTLTVGFVGDSNMSNQTATTNDFALSALSVTPALTGSTSKAYDGTTSVSGGLTISLNGVFSGDTVSAAGSFAYENAAVGTGKNVIASGITLSGTDNEFYMLSANTAASQVGTIHKAMLTGMTPPTKQTLKAYYTSASAASAELPATVMYTVENGGTVELNADWTCQNYDSTPSAENTFTWTVDNEANLASYLPADGVAATGSIVVTNVAAIRVSLKGDSKSITYDGSTFDVSTLFTIDQNAGAPSYAIASGGEGEGTLSGSMLTITKSGSINIDLATAANGIYAAGKATAALTVNNGTPIVTIPTGLTAVYSQTLSKVELPKDAAGAWSWENGAASVGNAGMQTHKAIFTPNDQNLWNAVTVDVTVNVLKSATDLTGEGLNHENGQYIYGEDIVVTLQAAASGNAARRMSLGAFAQPQARQMALYKRVEGQPDEQITSPVSKANGAYVLTLHTEDKLLPIGKSSIVAKYVGDADMADTETLYTVTITKKPLTLSDIKANPRYFKTGSKTVEITSATLNGLEATSAGTDDVKFAAGQTGTISSDAVGAYTTVELAAPALDGADAGWYTAQGGELAADVRILAIPEGGFKNRVSIKESYTDADVQETDLGKIPQLDTVAEIDTQLRLNVAQKGALTDSATLYDVVLEYMEADGTWRRADKEHFPAGGIVVSLPAIAETTPATHTYTVAHMFTMNMNGHKAGEVEYPAPTAYQDAKGRWMLKFTVTGMSPMMVAAVPVPVLPQTGDQTNIVLYTLLLAVSVIILAAANKRRTE